MSRDEVVASVRDRVPVDGREARSRHRFLVAMDRLARPLDQGSDRTHVTGSALIVGPRGLLLLRHKRLGIWVQPGGHIEPGETPWEAARREAQEETGIAFRPYRQEPPPLAHLDVHDGGRGHVHLDLRYVLHPEGPEDPRPPAGESQEVAWFTWESAWIRADPGLAGWVRSRMEP